MRLTQILNSNANSYPNKIATIDGDRQKNWTDLRDRVSRLAGALKKLGMKPKDRVAILSLNSDRYTEFLFAVWWAGGAVVPMNTRWSVDENVYALNDSGAQILFLDQNFSSMAGEIMDKAKDVKIVVSLNWDAPENMPSFETLIDENGPCDDADCGYDDLAGLFYTGGTTGFPKAVMISHGALWYNFLAAIKPFNVDRHSVYIHAAPMFHVADFFCGGATALAGATSIYTPAFDAVSTVDLIEKHNVTHTILVPTMLGMVLNHPLFDPTKLRSLQHYMYGASPMPEGLLRNAMATLPNVKFVQAYGQTEMGPIVSFLEPGDHVLDGLKSKRLRSAGLPAVGCEVKIVDEDRQELPSGEVGEIVARSPGSMIGYWNLPDQTAEALVDGWVYTGDGAYQDEDGFVFIVDRMKDMIISGGENVFSAEVENTISTHPNVAAVAVIGIPSEKWGESVHAIVMPKSDSEIDENEIIQHCKDRIAGYKCPSSISIRDTPFPISGAGKVLKRDLRAPYWEGRDRDVS